ncbi:MAG TPA: PAS domain S-box protein [Longimicrobiaceae bacterium]|nr:PAS domain S-box protein [Longimicrobiaceae bacterium]
MPLLETVGSSVGTAVELAEARARVKQLEMALHESEARFHSLVEQPLAGIYILHGERLAYVNPHCKRIFGYTAEEMVSQFHIADLLVEEDRKVMRDHIARWMAGEKSQVRHALRGTRKDGERVELQVHGARTEIEGESAVIGILLDITERKRAESALREREEQLRHAQKLEAVGRLAGGIAHDFNNLLMVIQGSVNLILMDPKSDNPHRGDLEEIVRATERAAALTRQLLAFGRKQVLRPKVVNLNTAVEDLHKMMRRVIGEDIELKIEADADLRCVRVDPGQLEQVLLNLIVNSRDAMPRGGLLTIRTENSVLTEEDAEKFPYRVIPGPYARMVIQDTGHGMPESVLARVFEPFFTTKEQGKGSGLGLSMVYGIIKQSGGYIWSSSQPSRGTTVEIYLPSVDDVVEPSLPTSPADLPRGSGKVLLVEDEEPVRAVTSRLLQHAGYEVIEAGGGREAMERFDECNGAIDLVVTDVVMPQMGGRELAAHLTARKPSLRLLYMSGYADDRKVRRGSDDKDFIQKPFAPEVLLERIQRVLAR